MTTKKKKSLSHELALQDALKFLGFANGQVANRTNRQAPMTPGLDIFVPFTEQRRVRLIGEGAMLDGNIKQILTISVAGTNETRADMLTGKFSVASSTNNMWWNVPLIIKETAEDATATLEMGLAHNPPMPLVRLSDLIEANDNPAVKRVLEAVLTKSQDTNGPSYYNMAQPIIENADQAFLVFAPSSSPNANSGIWTNPPSTRSTPASAATDGSVNPIELMG